MIGAAMVAYAGERYEELGDVVLLAYRCTRDREVKAALAWFLDNRVPRVGQNRFAKEIVRRQTS
jgi:hypothetical protein